MNANLDTLDVPPAPGHALKSGEGVKVEKAVTVNCSISQAYSFWRDLKNLPLFMDHLLSVETLSETESRWVAQTPKGHRVTWDARIIDEKRDELISWQSVPGGDLDSAGSVRFSPAIGNRGTVVKVALKYAPARGRLAKMFAQHFSTNAKMEIAQNLFHFKSLMETGEIPTIEGQPKGNKNPES